MLTSAFRNRYYLLKVQSFELGYQLGRFNMEFGHFFFAKIHNDNIETLYILFNMKIKIKKKTQNFIYFTKRNIF